MWAVSVVRRTGGEVWWWMSGVAGYGWRHKRQMLVLALVVLAFWYFNEGLTWLPLLALSPLLVSLVWRRCWPVSYRVQVADRSFRWHTRRWLRRNWASVMDACGLSRRGPARMPVQTPALTRLGWEDSQLVAVPRLLTGQTVDDVDAVSERLRVALNANRLRVLPDSALTGCRLVWSFGDPLAEMFCHPVPNEADICLDEVVLGRTEDGAAWRLPVRTSTLVAGSTGAGKGSVLWSLALGLAPAVKAGLVQLHGIDLKGGMELGPGRALFTRYATDAAEAVVMLEDAVTRCEQRATRLAGVTRLHQPTTAEPLVVVVIDELASLVAYLPDRDLLKRAEAALSRLLSIGRAPGFYVFAFLQDPRKETVRMRHLFTQAIALRLRDKEEATMVHGEGAVNGGARCHKISRATPGVGYVIGEDGLIVKVRAGFVTDDVIRATAARFVTPTVEPITLPTSPGDDQDAPTPRARRPRTSRRRTTSDTAEVGVEEQS